MKQVASMLLFVVITTMLLAGCGQPPESATELQPVTSDSKASQATSSSSSSMSAMPSSSTSIATLSPPENFDVVQIPAEDANNGSFGETMLTKSQDSAVITLVQSVVNGYREGWLPLPIVEGTEGRLGQPLPDGVQLPETVNYGDVAMTTDGNEMWGGMKATLTLNNGYALYVWVAQTKDEQMGDIIFIIDAGFELTQ